MFVITADQIASRSRSDIIAPTLARIQLEHGTHLRLPADRNAGDEIQMLTTDAPTVLALVLELTRNDAWSVGLGVGPIAQPLPSATREGTGPAYYAARDAVNRAKKRGTHFAFHGGDSGDSESTACADGEALIDLVLAIRQRRTAQGWELYDLMERGLNNKEAAEELGISAPAASARAKAALLKIETDAVPALVRLLTRIDRSSTT